MSDAPSQSTSSRSNTLVRGCIILILASLAIFLISFLVIYIIPGCHFDEGSGASRACGKIGAAIELGVFVGFGGFLLGVVAIFPIAGYQAVVDLFSRNGKLQRRIDASMVEALIQFRQRGASNVRCPECESIIAVTTQGIRGASATKCRCGRCDGIF